MCRTTQQTVPLQRRFVDFLFLGHFENMLRAKHHSEFGLEFLKSRSIEHCRNWNYAVGVNLSRAASSSANALPTRLPENISDTKISSRFSFAIV